MNLPLTYGQCLRKIMQNNQLTVQTLCRKMGYRSATQLTRILGDEVSPTLITKFHHQFMLIFDWLISPAEIRDLSTSLQFSCLGAQSFLMRRAMQRMLFDRTLPRLETFSLHIHPHRDDAPATLDALFRTMRRYQSLDLLVLSSAFDTPLPFFSALSKRNLLPENTRIRHFFVMEDDASHLIARVSALMPFLNTSLYEGAYCTSASPHAVRFLTQNPIVLTRSVDDQGNVHTCVIPPPQKDGISICRLDGDTLYNFYLAQLQLHLDDMRSIKSVYPKPKTVDSLLTLCQRDLFMEQNRACCFVRLDLCFHVLPTPIVIEAAGRGARLGMAYDDPMLQELIRVHETRRRNLFEKEEPTYFILSRKAMTEFTQTGHMSDHLFAMRNFTPEERKAILEPLSAAMHEGKPIHIHFLSDDSLTPLSSFAAYSEMGVQISANDATYNMAEHHDEVFISLPAFEDAFHSYCIGTLIPEYCLSREESLAFLDSLIAQLG